MLQTEQFTRCLVVLEVGSVCDQPKSLQDVLMFARLN
jgi:hypothetical protein